MNTTHSNPIPKRGGKFTLESVTAMMVLVATAAIAQPNRLTNGDFEAAGSINGTPPGWTGVGGSAANQAGGVLVNADGLVYDPALGGDNDQGITHPAIGTQSCKVYGDFSGAPNTMGVYQELTTGGGSEWSATGKVQTKVPDNLGADDGGTNEVWLEVSFRGLGGGALAIFRSATVTLDSPVDTWIDLPVTTEYSIIDEDVPPSLATPLGSVDKLVAPAGTASVRYQLKFYQPQYQGGSVYFDEGQLVQLAASDPEFVSEPKSRTEVVGSETVFSVSVVGTEPITYQWYKDDQFLSDGGRVSGSQTDTLTVSDLTLEDGGTYKVSVAGLDFLESSAQLKVITEEEDANLLTNPGFEDGVDALPWETAWVRFNGGTLETTNDFVFESSEPVQSHSGMYVSKTWNGAPDNGLFQDVPGQEGMFYTAQGWFRTATPDNIGGANQAWFILEFRDAGDQVIEDVRSPVINTNFPVDTWVSLVLTNESGSEYLEAPAGTEKVRCLIFFNGQPDSGGSIYYDDLSLLLKAPVSVSHTVVDDTIELSFPTQKLTQYQVWYKDDLNAAEWTLLETVEGDGTAKTVTDAIGGGQRYYSVTTE